MRLENFRLSDLGDCTSKLKLAKVLEISTRTLYEYHDIAMLIADFESDYPAFIEGDAPITQCPLTKYQSWVLFALMLNCRRLPRAKVNQCFLEGNNPQFIAKFSKEYFVSNYGELSNDNTAVCKVA